MEIKSLEMGMPLVQDLLRERTRLQARVTELESELIYTKLAQKTELKQGSCSGVEDNDVLVVQETHLGKRARDCSQRNFGESANDENKKKIEELENGLKLMQEKVRDMEARHDDAGIRKSSEDDEKEQLHERILVLERKLDEKQELEVEFQCLEDSLRVMKHMAEDGDVTVKKKMEAIEEKLKEMQEFYDYLEEGNQVLMIKERRANDELQEARKELIRDWSNNEFDVGRSSKRPELASIQGPTRCGWGIEFSLCGNHLKVEVDSTLSILCVDCLLVTYLPTELESCLIVSERSANNILRESATLWSTPSPNMH